MAWVLLTNVGFAMSMSSPALDAARLKQLLSPEPTSLWSAFFRNWRSYPTVFVAFIWLGAGVALEIFGSRFAKYVNVGFFAACVLLWTPGLVALFRGNAEPEGVAYMVVFGGSALMIAVIDYFLYRPQAGKIQTT
jgi:hypothetical protein